ncbi:MAG: MFS transporter [Frankia sp.]
MAGAARFGSPNHTRRPEFARQRQLSAASQQWVITAYLTVFGGFLLLAARVSDLFGRRRVFLIGLAVFTLASLAGGLANSGALLLTARAVQGLGSAALAPASLSLITASHYEPAQRTKALSYWSAAASSAGAAGLVLGGLLTDKLSWRWVLFINVPIGVLLYAAAASLLAPSRPDRARRLDVPGAVLVTAATAGLVYGISQATDHGWAAGRVVYALCSAAVLVIAFALVEQRVQSPLIPPSIYRHARLRVANLIAVALGAIMTSTTFFLSVYEQQSLGYSPLRTGLSLLPWTVVLVIGTFAARHLLPRLGVVRLMVLGSLLTAAGLFCLAWLPDRPAYLSHILGPTLITGAGMSLVVLPITIAATTDVAPPEAGLASGLLNMGRQIGGALGLAVLVTIATTAAQHSHRPLTGAVVHGYHIALLVAAALSAATAATALLLRQRTETPERATAAETSRRATSET